MVAVQVVVVMVMVVTVAVIMAMIEEAVIFMASPLQGVPPSVC